jgi:DNA-directed RNA polymerase specialized sigma subunit
MKNVYEIFDEFELASSKKDKVQVLQNNMTNILASVLQLAFNPNIDWHIKQVPENYQPKEIPAGMSYARLTTELRKLYLFQKGNQTADTLTEKKREQLLVEYLDNLEPREAEVIMGIFNKDLGVKGLNAKFLKENFPNLIN